MDVRTAINDTLVQIGAAIDYTATPWLLYQTVIIICLFLAAKLVARRVEPLLEGRARRIKGHPGLLRVVVALLRRTNWILFSVFLLVALTLMRSVTQPSQTHLLVIALSLSLAWLFASVLSRIIRNRLVGRTLGWFAWIYAALVILGISDEAAAFLDSLAFPLGAMRISALTVLKAAVLLIATVWLAIVVGNYFDERVQSFEELTPSIRILIGKVAKIGLVLVAGAIALSSVGVDLSALTVFSGAVGVGVGFGLQKVVSNFVSGVIILLDKSIKPGDTISLEGTFGWIRELRARFVSVVTRDGHEYLIPNEDFITRRVINWSFSDKLVRLDVNFGVSYKADPHKVIQLAIEAALGVDRVEADHGPVCWLTGFGESSLDFVLRFWIHDPQQGLTNVRGNVLLALWDTFKENGIEIPYPHRELIMKQGTKGAMTGEFAVKRWTKSHPTKG
ncbi:mechanosensitive ion channel family protein [Mesorhizobium soli]|uniref:mechanosensitive ion channel family protein n=1 Tax=Pseudaminobacter soli (ex Li et al. 2025) TaxID=1295366 RepID=UPI002475924F|nr:mechanosensitive ion channel domain-containing protein [Mesorhizobium soli]